MFVRKYLLVTNIYVIVCYTYISAGTSTVVDSINGTFGVRCSVLQRCKYSRVDTWELQIYFKWILRMVGSTNGEVSFAKEAYNNKSFAKEAYNNKLRMVGSTNGEVSFAKEAYNNKAFDVKEPDS